MLTAMAGSIRGLAERLRAARQAKGLSLDAAARELRVAKSTVARWERGELNPRDHWPDVEKLYGKSRLELEFGVTEASAGGEPPYPGWQEFIDWLEAAPLASAVEPWMLAGLRQIRTPNGEAMTFEGYRMLLLAILSAPRGEQ